MSGFFAFGLTPAFTKFTKFLWKQKVPSPCPTAMGFKTQSVAFMTFQCKSISVPFRGSIETWKDHTEKSGLDNLALLGPCQ